MAFISLRTIACSSAMCIIYINMIFSGKKISRIRSVLVQKNEWYGAGKILPQQPACYCQYQMAQTYRKFYITQFLNQNFSNSLNQ